MMDLQMVTENKTIEDPFGLRPLWDATLDLYLEFASVCEMHGFRHYAAFGTALGAVRHKGFIPWDDDFDVYMPRPDYDKFFEICAKGNLKNGIGATNVMISNKHTLQFGKFYIDDHKKIDSVREASGLDLDQGIFIDVFPLDGLPDNKIAFGFWILKRAVWRRIGRYIPASKQASFRRKRDRWGLKWPYEKSHFVQCYQENLCKIKDRLYTREMFGTPKWVDFDRIKIAVPEDVEGYLRAEFGDYMKLPPEDKRVPSHQKTKNWTRVG